MTQPKVSIIVPVYNTEKYLERCIVSLTAQTLQDIEIIMVDDGSAAACAALCDELAGTDARIKVIHKENAGPGYARNSGLEAANGEYVGFVDSDDYVDACMYEHLYTAAEKYTAQLVISGLSFVGGNTFAADDTVVPKPHFTEDTVFENEELRTLLLGVVGALPHEEEDRRYGVSVCKNLFRTSLIKEKQLRFFSERDILSEDTIFMVDYIGLITRAVGVDGAYYYYCRNEGSVSKSYKPGRFEKCRILLNELEKRLSETMPQEEYALYLNRLKQSFGRVFCSQEVVHARDEKIPYATLRKQLKEICTCREVSEALRTYPWYKLPKKQAAFAFAMKYRLFWLQKMMVLLRDR